MTDLLCYHLAHARCFLSFLMAFFPNRDFGTSSHLFLTTTMFATFFLNFSFSLMLLAAESLKSIEKFLNSSLTSNVLSKAWNARRYHFLDVLLCSHMIQQSFKDLASSFSTTLTPFIHSVSIGSKQIYRIDYRSVVQCIWFYDIGTGMLYEQNIDKIIGALDSLPTFCIVQVLNQILSNCLNKLNQP